MKSALTIGCLLGLAVAAPAQARFTLAQVMGSPFPSSLTAAASGEHIAWSVDARGVRNIFIADGPDFVPRPLTHYAADDGQPISAVQITPDGGTVVYARGSEINNLGDAADPDASATRPEQQVWSVREGGAPKLLGTMGCDEEGCEDIEVSPDGRWVVWPAPVHPPAGEVPTTPLRDEIWIAPVDGSAPARVLAWSEGDNVAPQWSPDSRSIAFVSQRPGHSFIGVYTLGASQVRYVAPSVAQDSEPRWAPDGRHLIFVRQRLEAAVPGAPPLPQWELWIADARTLAAHEFWQSGTAPADGIDPNYNGVFEAALRVGADHRVLFASEADGWNHLYVVSDSGTGLNRARALTPGAFEIKDVILTRDGQGAIYSSNQGDPDRRHLWRVPLDGSAPPQALTHGASIEWSPVETGDGRALLCLGSSATTPAMPYEISATGTRRMLSPLPADFPTAELVAPTPVIFPSTGGWQIHGQWFQASLGAGPSAASPRVPLVLATGRGPHRPSPLLRQPRPTLIFVHGGPHRQMMLGFHPMDYYHNAYAENQYLVSLGFNVLSINYRSGIMYGRAFRTAPNTGKHGASDYADVLAAVRYLRTLPSVDAHRIGIWGGSYGGYLTALALARNSNLFAAGVDFHGVHDWSTVYDGAGPAPALPPSAPGVPPAGQPGNPQFDASPDAALASWHSPVLLIQGDDDRNVDFLQLIGLVRRLRAQRVPFELLVFPDEIHVFLRWSTWMRSYAATADFFQRVLQQRAQISTAN